MNSRNKIIKKFLLFILIVVLPINSFAAVSVSDGSAFVSKSEFSSTINNISNRMSIIENTLDAKIDSLVSSYLSRNGIWNGDKQTVEKPYWVVALNSGISIPFAEKNMTSDAGRNIDFGSLDTGTDIGRIKILYNNFWTIVNNISKTGLMHITGNIDFNGNYIPSMASQNNKIWYLRNDGVNSSEDTTFDSSRIVFQPSGSFESRVSDVYAVASRGAKTYGGGVTGGGYYLTNQVQDNAYSTDFSLNFFTSTKDPSTTSEGFSHQEAKGKVESNNLVMNGYRDITMFITKEAPFSIYFFVQKGEKLYGNDYGSILPMTQICIETLLKTSWQNWGNQWTGYRYRINSVAIY